MSTVFVHLYVVALMVVTAFSEQSVVYHLVDVELVKKRITVLHPSV